LRKLSLYRDHASDYGTLHQLTGFVAPFDITVAVQSTAAPVSLPRLIQFPEGWQRGMVVNIMGLMRSHIFILT